jgi:hypothetical protein
MRKVFPFLIYEKVIELETEVKKERKKEKPNNNGSKKLDMSFCVCDAWISN